MPHLRELSIAYTLVTDEGVCALREIECLELLNLKHTELSSRVILKLAEHHSSSLRGLDISNTGVCDQTLQRISSNSRIRELTLSDTAITDASCSSFNAMEGLAVLSLGRSQVTDDGIRHLNSCQELNRLELHRTGVTDTSAVWLVESRIEYLGLKGTSFTDVGAPALAEFAELRSLDLRNTAITDRGLRFLSDCPRLEELYLESTNITNAGLASLQKLSLATISLGHEIDQIGHQTLSRFSSLRHLALKRINPNCAKLLLPLKELRVLLVSDQIEHPTVLQNLPELKVLIFFGSRRSMPLIWKVQKTVKDLQIIHVASYRIAFAKFLAIAHSS